MTDRWESDRQDAGSRRNTSTVPARPDVAEQLRQLDCDPIAGMAKFAQDDTVPMALRARMFAELAKYVVPRLKAMELTGRNGGPIDLGASFNASALSDEELETLISMLEKAAVKSPQ
jgi:hypothetical protein